MKNKNKTINELCLELRERQSEMTKVYLDLEYDVIRFDTNTGQSFSLSDFDGKSITYNILFELTKLLAKNPDLA